MNVGLKIRILRVQNRMSQGQLAERLGINQAVMSRIESGKRQLNLAEIEQLSDIFGVQPSFFLSDARPGNLDAMYKRGELGRIAERNGNIGALQPASELVPIFDIEGGYAVSFDDGGHPTGQADKFQAVSPADIPSASFFGCDLHGDSMQQGGEPSFREGDRLFFDPASDVRNCAFAFVRTIDGTSTFKQVFFDSDATVRLHPLNSRYADVILPREQIVAMWPLVYRIQRFM